MKKFTFFLFLFFSVFCFAQNKAVKTAPREYAPTHAKQINSARQNNITVQQKPTVYVINNNASTHRESSPNIALQIHSSAKPFESRPTVIQEQKEQKPSLQKEDSFKQVPLNKEEKPTPPKPNRPTPRPGNYNIVYWTNFIDTQSSKEREWATKVLDVKNISLDGKGVLVAVLDSGIKSHSQFDGANIEILDITGHNDPFDFCGHGTAVAGIIVGRSFNDFRGIAPAVNLKSYKIADESGTTNNTYIINALDSILEYNRQNTDKISIINISYGLEQDNAELRNKLAEAYSSGITIISASGNDGKEGLLYPAAYDFVFAAGSIDKDKKLSDFSNWGKGLDFVLPGSSLKTLGLNNDYVWVRGTSFSSAYLTGVAALATQAFKNKNGRLPTPQELYEVLQKISTPVKTIPLAKQGFGVPDASKIVSYI